MARSRHRGGGASRGFDRTDRLNELLARIVAEEIERIDDERLGLVTVTGVETDRDLNRATVFVTGDAPDDDVLEALDEQRSRLQRAIGERARLRRTPPLDFRTDEAARSAARIEDILRGLREGDGSAAGEPLDGDGSAAGEPVDGDGSAAGGRPDGDG